MYSGSNVKQKSQELGLGPHNSHHATSLLLYYNNYRNPRYGSVIPLYYRLIALWGVMGAPGTGIYQIRPSIPDPDQITGSSITSQQPLHYGCSLPEYGRNPLGYGTGLPDPSYGTGCLLSLYLGFRNINPTSYIYCFRTYSRPYKPTKGLLIVYIKLLLSLAN